MEAAKNAIGGFLSRSGRHDTAVDEQVQDAVTSQTVKPTRHEETTQAVDREVHQDHYHTTVQPIKHQEVLPEQHTHNLVPTEHREFQHEDEGATQQKLATEAARFADSSTTHDTKHTSSQAPVQTGEHVHHHVHEVVQPVVYKTTHQPEVVHTTIPIHEKVFAPSEHHGISMLPTQTLGDFKSAGGDITGSQGRLRREEYEGHPRRYNPALQQERAPVDLEPEKHYGTHDLESTGHPPLSPKSAKAAAAAAAARADGHSTSSANAGRHDSNLANKADPRIDSDRDGSRSIGAGAAEASLASHQADFRPGPEANSSRGVSAAGTEPTGAGPREPGGTGAGYGATNAGPHDSNLANGADPRVDSDRDGSRGVGAGPTLGQPVQGHDSSTAGYGIGAGGAAVAGVGAGEAAGGLAPEEQNRTGKTAHGFQTGTHSISGTEPESKSLEERGFATGTGVGSTAGKLNPTNTAPDGAKDATTSSSNAAVQPSRTTDANSGNKGAGKQDDDVQHASQGKDPAVQTSQHEKLRGDGVDGSHSAVFGLTPDGHKFDDTAHGTSTPAHPAHSKDAEVGSKSTSATEEDTGSRKPTGAGVSEQMNDPKVAQKGHDGQQSYGEAGAGDKPGSGSLSAKANQGTGDAASRQGASTGDKLNPKTDADGDGKAGVMD